MASHYLLQRRITSLQTSTLLLAVAVIGPLLAIMIMRSDDSEWARENAAPVIAANLLFFSSPLFSILAAVLSVRDHRRTKQLRFTVQIIVACFLVVAFVLFILALRGAA